MAVRRAVFRIEEQAGRRSPGAAAPADVGAVPPRSSSPDPRADSALNDLARELRALGSDAQSSVERILSAAEHLEQITAQLSETERKLLGADMQDCLSRIFAACSLHDLAGQRIARALAMLRTVDGGRADAPAPPRPAEPLQAPAPPMPAAAPAPFGPMRHDDHGHMTQREIDALFAAK